MSASSRDLPRAQRSIAGGGTVVALPAGSGGMDSDHPELDALFQASRQVEQTLIRERAAAARLKSDMQALQTRHQREVNQSKQQLKHYAVCYEEARSQLEAAQAKLRSVTEHARKLRDGLVFERENAAEQAKKTQLDLGVARSALEHSRNQVRSLEQALAQLRPDAARAQSDLERAQAEALEREHKYQAALLTQRSHEKTLQDTIASLKDQLRRAQAELGQYKSRWIEAERIREDAALGARRREDLEARLRELTEANRALNERLHLEKRRREHAEHSARSGGNEAAMLKASLHSAQSRLAEAEKKLQRMATETARARTAGAETERSPLPRYEFEGIEGVALMGYPVKPGRA